jgi:hypothetical protein
LFLSFLFHLTVNSYQSPNVSVIVIITCSAFSRSSPLLVRIQAKYRFHHDIDQHHHRQRNNHPRINTPSLQSTTRHDVFELVLRPGYQGCLHIPPIDIINQYVSHQSRHYITLTLTLFQHTPPPHHRVTMHNRPIHRGGTETNHQPSTTVEVRHMTRTRRVVRRMEATTHSLTPGVGN